MAYAHIGFNVKNLPASTAFYKAALGALGLSVMGEGEGWITFGKNGRNALWIGSFGPHIETPLHLAYEAASKEEVDAFHAAALAAGGKDNGAPGIRANYAPDYYAAFAFDPDGHNVEAVFRG